jgi:hypothetical protein
MSGIELKGAVGELHMKVQVKRADTGKVEEYDVTGFVNPEQLKQLQDAGILPPQPEGESNG